MKKAIILLVAVWSISLPAAAEGPVRVLDAWARASILASRPGAAYATIESASDDRLLGVTTPAADHVMIHAVERDGDISRMKHVDVLDIPAEQRVALAPGGMHMMLKRHILTDTEGNMLGAITHTADVQDRDGAPGVVAGTKESFPTLAHLFADGGYAGEKLETALQTIDGPTIQIVKRPNGATGFVVIARRWVVERTFVWLGRCRRLAKDWEATIASSDAWLLIASIRRTARLIARD